MATAHRGQAPALGRFLYLWRQASEHLGTHRVSISGAGAVCLSWIWSYFYSGMVGDGSGNGLLNWGGQKYCSVLLPSVTRVSLRWANAVNLHTPPPPQRPSRLLQAPSVCFWPVIDNNISRHKSSSFHLFSPSRPEFHQASHWPDRGVRRSCLIRVSGHRWPQATRCVEQKRKESQLSAHWGQSPTLVQYQLLPLCICGWIQLSNCFLKKWKTFSIHYYYSVIYSNVNIRHITLLNSLNFHLHYSSKIVVVHSLFDWFVMLTLFWMDADADHRVWWGSGGSPEDSASKSTAGWEHLRVCGPQHWRRNISHLQTHNP